MKALDLIDQRFGHLHVIEQAPSKDGTMWLCLCDCGNRAIVRGKLLKKGHTKSCGCLRYEGTQSRHGHSRRGQMSRTYRAWARMRQRCLTPSCKDFPNYGGRGIRVDDRWSVFDNFLADLGECPDRLELDRIDPNGHYTPNNCRWATEQVQAENRNWTRWVTIGEKKVTMKQAAAELGLSYSTLKQLTARNGKYRLSTQDAIDRLLVSRRK